MRKLILLAVLLSPASAFAEQYLCLAEKAVGFKYFDNQKNWASSDFDSGSKYTLSNSSGSFLLRSPNFEEPLATCGDFNEAGVINCDGWVHFVFNKKSGRFTESHQGSYHLVGSELFPKDGVEVPTPSVSIGKCTFI